MTTRLAVRAQTTIKPHSATEHQSSLTKNSHMFVMEDSQRPTEQHYQPSHPSCLARLSHPLDAGLHQDNYPNNPRLHSFEPSYKTSMNPLPYRGGGMPKPVQTICHLIQLPSSQDPVGSSSSLPQKFSYRFERKRMMAGIDSRNSGRNSGRTSAKSLTNIGKKKLDHVL